MIQPKSFTLLFILCAVLTSAAFLKKEDPSTVRLPKIPMYVGSSYHILYGNPKSEYGLDPGFYHPVFEFSYSKNKTTED
jgi:hypothetical protein